MQDLLLNNTGLSLAPSEDRSKSHSPLFNSLDVAALASVLSSGCIKMYPIPVALQSVFRNNGFDESNRASSGDDTILCFNELKSPDRFCVHAGAGIFPFPQRVYKSRNGLHWI